MKKVLYILMLLFAGNTISAQVYEYKKDVREGNSLYEEEKYEEAGDWYENALDKNPSGYEGKFNLGDAYYRQKKYADAAQNFEELARESKDKSEKAKAYHNLGNSLLQSGKYEESVEAYKNALRNNPSDEDTRYNLSYALQKLQEQQKQKQKQDQDQQKDDENQEKNKDKKKQDKEQKEKDQQQQQDQNKEQQDQKEEQKQQQQPQQQRMSKEDAERMLEALQNKEKDVQDKLKKKKVKKGRAVEIEKDW